MLPDIAIVSISLANHFQTFLFKILNMRPLHDRYDGLKMLEFSLTTLKNQSIALLFTSFLRKLRKITLFLLSAFFRAKVSI